MMIYHIAQYTIIGKGLKWDIYRGRNNLILTIFDEIKNVKDMVYGWVE